MEYEKWYTDIFNKDNIFSSTNTMQEVVEKVIDTLGWTGEKHFVTSAAQKQKILDELNEGRPVLAVIHGMGVWHCIAIIGSNSNTGKLIALDSAVPDTGTEFYFSFEDIFFEQPESSEIGEFDRIYTIQY